MQSARTTTLKLKQPLKQSLKRLTAHQTRKMSYHFPGSFFASPSANNNTSFHPLFRLLDDFEQHSRNSDSATEGTQSHRQLRTNMKSFTPKFDVKELADVYELHGDLPGIEQKDVEIEFSDIQTITIRGRTERSFTSGTPSGFIEGSASPAAIEGSEKSHAAPKPATVEDEDAVMVTDPSKSANANTEVATTSKSNNVEKSEPKAKYWVSERSVGEFSRSFTFPVRVDQDAVSASMKNGVLTITVPKAKKHEAKKIPIWSM